MRPVPTVVIYVPALHQGLVEFLKRHRSADVCILDRSVTSQFRDLVKDLRALDPDCAVLAVASWKIANSVRLAGPKELQDLARGHRQVIMPDEELSRTLAAQYFNNQVVKFDQVFLRWDRRQAEAKTTITPNQTISRAALARKFMNQAAAASHQSSDMWRHIGAVIAKNDRALVTGYNQALPSAHTPWAFGDPRNNYHQGVRLEASVFIHAEAQVIAQAARQGISLEGTSLYVTTFPCPVCAKLIAASGIKTCYFAEGYGLLDAEQVLASAGVKVIRVQGASPTHAHEQRVPYPKT